MALVFVTGGSRGLGFETARALKAQGHQIVLFARDTERLHQAGQELEYLGGATASGLVLGARVPIALTSRADSPDTRVASAVLALIAAHAARKDPIRKAQLGR